MGNSAEGLFFNLTDVWTIGRILAWAKRNDRLAPNAGHRWFWRYLLTAGESALSSVSIADLADSLKTEKVIGWLQSELRPPD